MQALFSSLSVRIFAVFGLLEGAVLVVSVSVSAQEVKSLGDLREQFAQQRALLDSPVGELNELYEKQLGALRDKLRGAGELEKVLIVDDEIKSYRAADRRQPPAFPELERLREIYGVELTRRRKEIAAKLPRFLESYATQLDNLAIELTKLDRLPDAIAAKDEAKHVRQELGADTSIPANVFSPPGASSGVGRLKGFGSGPKTDPVGETGRSVVDVVAVRYWERDTFDAGWVALRANGTLFSDKERRLTSGRDHIVAFTCSGGGGIVALKEDGTLDTSLATFQPPAEIAADLVGIVDVALGQTEGGPDAEAVVAVKNDGSLAWWGPATKAVGVTGPPEEARSDVVNVVSGRGTYTALKRDGSAVAWKFQAGGDGRVNLPASAQTGLKQIAMSESHTVALKADGTVVAWGPNNEGQSTVPADLGPCTEVAVIHNVGSVARRQDGSWVAWGRNYGGLTEHLNGKNGMTQIVGRMFPPGGYAFAVWIEEEEPK